MSQELVSLTLLTQPAKANAQYKGLHNALAPQAPTVISFDIVTGIVETNGTTHTNPRHYNHIDTFALSSEEGDTGITLEEEKATRLVEVFKSLRPGHLLDCHDFVATVEAQPEDTTLRGHFLYTPDECIESGSVYCIMARGRKTPYRTHSAYGTDNHRLFGIMGKGLALSIIDPETARNIYGSGMEANVCQPIPWAVAA